jgi:predicted tellurium resistance membrane protein TerC
MSFEWIFSTEAVAGLLTLTALEIVLGIDNVIFLSILVARMPVEKQATTRRLGLLFAAATRIGLLSVTAWMSRMVAPIFAIGSFPVSVRDLVLGGGGLFLIAKATTEIHGMLDGKDEGHAPSPVANNMAVVVAEIALLDIVFSLDSVITAVGMVDHIAIMYAAVISSTAVMLLAAGPIATFIARHPTAKMLALAFLLLIGVALIADGMHFHIPRAYLYSAIAFSVGVEALNLVARKRGAAKQDREAARPAEAFAPDSATVRMLVSAPSVLRMVRPDSDDARPDHPKVPLATWR